MEENYPKELELVGKVQVINRQAESCGFKGKMMKRRLKTMIKFRNRLDGLSFLHVFTLNKDIRPKFDITKKCNVRSTFLNEGMLTIEIMDNDNTTILIKEADPGKLQNLVAAINLAKKIKVTKKNSLSPTSTMATSTVTRDASTTSTSTESSSSTAASSNINLVKKLAVSSQMNATNDVKTNMNIKCLMQSVLSFAKISEDEQRENIRRLDLKRVRSPSPTDSRKIEKKIIKIIRSGGLTNATLIIKTKPEYLKNIEPSILNLGVNGIDLKKIDQRVLQLANLRHLDLSNNSLKNVDVLKQMNSTLDTLNLSQNNIASLDSRLRFAWSKVTTINLRQNSLEMLPESFVFLTKLRSLDVSHNKLKCLPFNLSYLRNLFSLIANDNQLTFIPSQLASMHLIKLNISDNHRDLHYAKVNLAIKFGFGTLMTERQTLLEIAGEAILNGVLGKSGNYYNFDAGTLPDSVMEYLHRSKQCCMCRRMSLCYSYLDKLMPANYFAAENFSSDSNGRFIRLRTVICNKHIT